VLLARERHVLVAGEDLVAARSSYRLVSVAVMCIFSRMFRQPMPQFGWQPQVS
jgi:hypothetical protein